MDKHSVIVELSSEDYEKLLEIMKMYNSSANHSISQSINTHWYISSCIQLGREIYIKHSDGTVEQLISKHTSEKTKKLNIDRPSFLKRAWYILKEVFTFR